MCNLLGLQLAVPETSPGRDMVNPWEGARMSPACPWCVLTVAIPSTCRLLSTALHLGRGCCGHLAQAKGVGQSAVPSESSALAPWVWVLNVFPKSDHVTWVCLFILFMAFMYLCVYLFIYLYCLVPEKNLRQ